MTPDPYSHHPIRSLARLVCVMSSLLLALVLLGANPLVALTHAAPAGYISAGDSSTTTRTLDPGQDATAFVGNPTDTTPPDTTIDSHPTNPSNSNNATFTFSSEAWATFECRLDSSGFDVCASPKTYTGLTNGSHTFEARAKDAAGNVDPSPAGYTWTIDTIAPLTNITSWTPSPTANPNPVYEFTGSDPAGGTGVVSFDCRLLSATWEACPGGSKAYSGVADGSYTFEVRAKDAAGNVDATPATEPLVVDTISPTTTLTVTPPNPSDSSDATFEFTGDDGAGSGVSSFQCLLDDQYPYTACSSPKTYTGLSDGAHTFAVRAVDGVANVDWTPAEYSWAIHTIVNDTTPPETTIDSGPSNPTSSTSALFYFSSNEAGSTFECRFGVINWIACTNPKYYIGLVEHTYTFEVRATDPSGNTDPTPASYTWTIDRTAPDTTLTGTPANPSSSSDASFAFSSEAGATFDCQLDFGSFTACTSPQSYSGLTDGSHTFKVRAKDAAGNMDTSPAGFTWTIDATPPDTTITGQPSATTSSTSATFTFTGVDAASFECQLDGDAYVSCTSPQSYSGLTAGAHTFLVRAKDTEGRYDPTPAGYTWTIDTTPPDTNLTQTPPNPTTSKRATFAFSSETGATFECQLDGSAFSACTSPKNYRGLTEGSHTFNVRAKDAAGNVDASPAGYTWTISAPVPATLTFTNETSPAGAMGLKFAILAAQWGGEGSGDGQFEYPLGVAVDGAGHVYVADTENNRIQKFDGDGDYLAQWGSLGSSDGQFNYPGGVAVDETGHVYVTDAFNHRIQKFDGDGNYLDQWGVEGSGDGQFNGPFGVAVDGAGNVYVADTDNNRIQKFDGDGNYLDQWGGVGQGDGQFAQPMGVAIDGAGHVYVADTYNQRIQKFDGDGNYLAQWGQEIGSLGWFYIPLGVAVDAAGYVYVTDLNSYYIQKFDGDGNYLYEWWNPGGFEFAHNAPTGVAVDGAGHIYATNRMEHTIQKYPTPPLVMLDDGDSHTVTGLSAGTVVVGLMPNPWKLDSVVCNGGNPVNDDNSVSLTLAQGDVVTCTFTSTGPANTTPPTVTINQAAGQPDPTNTGPIHFTAVFSEPVTGFAANDVALASTAGAVTATVTEIHLTDGRAYDVAVSGMNTGGIVIANIGAGAAQDVFGNGNTASTSTDNSVNYIASDATPPTVTINQAAGQPDPTSAGPIHFTAVFSEPVSGFTGSDVALMSTAGDVTAAVTQIAPNNGTTFDVAVNRMNTGGIVIANIGAGAAQDAVGNGNTASTSTDNSVTYIASDTTPPTVTINQAAGQADPTSAGPIHFTAVFSEAVSDFATGDVMLSGTAGATTAAVTGGPTTYTVAVSGMTSSGTVVATIAAGAGHDAAGNGNTASTSTDNSVTYALDTTPPDTSLDSYPPDPSNSATAGFTFSSAETDQFECSLDDAPFADCASPHQVTNLADGPHFFAVRAVNDQGKADDDYPIHFWIVDTTPPTTTIAFTTVLPGSIHFTVHFTEPVNGFANDDVVLSGTAGATTAIVTNLHDRMEFDLDVSGMTGDGTIIIAIAAGVATDAAGNGNTAATLTWTIDTTGPAVTITAAPPDLTNDNNPSFSFSSEMGATFECQLDSGAWAACDSPWSYSDLSDGEHTFSVWATDATGNTGTAAGHTWTIDTTGPDTTINSGPSGITGDNDPSFGFSSETGATYKCQMDSDPFATCTSPWPYTNLSDGPHTFRVRATDAAGNTGPTAERAFTVDSAAPSVTIDTHPPALTNNNDPSFTFSGEPGAALACKLDGGAFAACDSPEGYTDLADGPHTFTVRAIDDAGNTAEAAYTWTIDTTPPVTTITAAPVNPSPSADATFTFTSESGAAFECRLDGGAWSACSSPKSYTGLSEAAHTFEVRATDAAVNTGPADSHTWSIDLPAAGALYVTASGGTLPGGLRYQKNDVLKWNGSAWSVWFDGAGKVANSADIIAFDVANESSGAVYLAFRQAQRGLSGLSTRAQPQDIVTYNGGSFSLFFDGSDVGLSLAGERINGIEVLPGSVSPIGTGCRDYLLISTNAGGMVRNGAEPAIRFTGEDVLGFCMTSSGPNTAGRWHLVWEGQAEGMPKNGALGLSASADAGTLYFTVRSAFNGENGPIRPSEVVTFNHTTRAFSAPLWRAADHGLAQQVDGIDVVGAIP